ncbi:MAG: TIGR02584 family CRISPR-associated protein [Alphaproteobacteria bacterium]|uniref:TIGR02584 family CRISPR-associated protein n=1 Tax=Candidatus Nitrobium versatile TaxID=2884831 RepID=A0A953LWL7_9BACT|nr:TIGR02584 family CRISPR-associated protein [Candidatus Nitrobium versatile]
MLKSFMKGAAYREIFIFIAGATPQVITETICVLAARKPPVLPDELYIITTGMGRRRAEALLIEKGVLKRLADEYGIPPIPLKPDSFIIPEEPSGDPLDDIRSEQENESMGDLILSFIRKKADDPAARLHCSLSGGRKTMSFYLGAALQLFGRPWDKLYHVLVSPEFESHPEFFYKPRRDKSIEVGGRQLNTRDAEIVLAELPFIRLRGKLLLEGTGFKELVAEGQREIDIALVQPELRISLPRRTVFVGEKAIKLPPFHLMLYVAYLKYKLYRCKYPERPYCLDCTECFPSMLELTTKPALEEMAKDYMVMVPSRTGDLLHNNKDGLGTDAIRQAVSKIRKAMTEHLRDETLVSCFSITTSLKEYANTKHGIRAEKSRIRIDDAFKI